MTEARDIDILHFCRSQTLRHLMLMVRSPSEVINPLLFFLLVIAPGLRSRSGAALASCAGDTVGSGFALQFNDLYAPLR